MKNILYTLLFLTACSSLTPPELPINDVRVESKPIVTRETVQLAEPVQMTAVAATAEPVTVNINRDNTISKPASLNSNALPVTRYYVESTKIVVNKTDSILNQLKQASMAFVVPASVNIDSPFIIQLMINPSLTESELSQGLTKSGVKSSDKISISKIVLARVVSSDFTITPITPESQAISNIESTEWLWEVTPKKIGIQDIELTITALVSVDGEKSQRHLKTFEKIINVEITNTQILKEFIKNYWQWLWTVCLTPLLALAWRKYQNRKS